MKVQTDARIDVAKRAHQAYTSLLETAYREFLAKKADSASDVRGVIPHRNPKGLKLPGVDQAVPLSPNRLSSSHNRCQSTPAQSPLRTASSASNKAR